MGNNFQAGYNRHEGFDKVENLGMRRGWGGEPFSRKVPLPNPNSSIYPMTR